MRTSRLSRLKATEFRSLADVDIPLGPLTVLAGTNGSGKTNVLNVLRFLAATVRFDLSGAVEKWGGLERVKRQGSRPAPQRVTIKLCGQLAERSNPEAAEEYALSFGADENGRLTRSESFRFRRSQKSPSWRIDVRGTRAETGPDTTGPLREKDIRLLAAFAASHTTGLSTLPLLSGGKGVKGIRALAGLLSSMRDLRPDINKARSPSQLVAGSSDSGSRLKNDARNLAAALHRLSSVYPEPFDSLLGEMRICLPGFDGIEFTEIGGPAPAVEAALRETGIRSPVSLSDASFGTVRLLVLLTALHEPDPPPLTLVETVDHGLSHSALGLLSERLRAASKQTQILATTYSPAVVNRLRSPELLICDRDPRNSASIIRSIIR